MPVLTIANILDELSCLTPVSSSNRLAAKKANITVVNNKDFSDLVEDYSFGNYDEDPDLLVQRITGLL